MSNLKYIGKNILNHDLILKKGNISGSNASTGSFGNLTISKNASITGNMVVGGTLTAQEIHTEIESASIIFSSGSTLFGNTQDDIHTFTGSLKITGSVTALNLSADSSSVSIRLTTEEANIDALQTDSGSFSTRVTNLKSDSGSFSTRTTTLEAASASFSTRVTTAEEELELTLISGSAQLESQISGAFTDGFEFNGAISGSSTSTGSFGHLNIKGSGDNVANFQAGNRTLSLKLNDSAPSGDVGVQFRAGASDYLGLAAGGGTSHGIVIHSNSDVAIGHGNPTVKLDVLGGIKASGDITANGNIVGDNATNISAVNDITALGDISGSATSTGSFGLVLQNGSELSTFQGAAGTETVFSGSAVSTGSFGRVEADSGSFNSVKTSGNITSAGGVTVTGTSKLQAFRTSGQFIEIYPDGNGSNYLQAQGNIRFAPNLGTKMILHSNGRLGINTTTDAGFQMDVNGTSRLTGNVTLGADISGSHDSTGSFGRLDIVDNVSATSFTGIFQGALSGSAQIASNISGAFAVASASISTRLTTEEINIDALQLDSGSFSTRVTNLKTDSGSFSTRVTNLKTDSGSFSTRVTNLKADSGSFSTRITTNSSSFAARDTLSEATSSKILNGQLEFTNITGSGHISMSLSSTGSFGRVSATTIGGHSPLVIDALTTFTNNITSSGEIKFDGKIFIQTGSIEGDLHVRTNENLMRIGKSTSGVIVSGSDTVSRFATGSDGSIIDLGFTAVDEDGNVVLAGDGDGIHLDGNNYWYNNKYYKVGDGVNNFLNYDALTLKYKGEVTAQTGSFGGEMFINSPTGSMFIGKFTGGIPSSGSDNVSRFATGSDGSIIDLGFTTTNEEGETVFLTTGDGIVRDDKNYWYTTGHFKVGDGQKQIEWNTTDLNISASTVDVTTLKASDVNFAGLPTSDPLVTGSLWVSGSATSGSFTSGYVMISGIHG